MLFRSYGYNLKTGTEDVAFSKETITIMAVDNLPCELPRDASDDFGKDLTDRVLPYLLGPDPDAIIDRATLCSEGALKPAFNYLSDYASSSL